MLFQIIFPSVAEGKKLRTEHFSMFLENPEKFWEMLSRQAFMPFFVLLYS